MPADRGPPAAVSACGGACDPRYARCRALRAAGAAQEFFTFLLYFIFLSGQRQHAKPWVAVIPQAPPGKRVWRPGLAWNRTGKQGSAAGAATWCVAGSGRPSPAACVHAGPAPSICWCAQRAPSVAEQTGCGQTDAGPGRCLAGSQGSVSSNSCRSTTQ